MEQFEIEKQNKTRVELIQLSGQIINGIMSSDSSIFSKICDRTSLDISAKRAVEMASIMLKEINDKTKTI